MVAVEAAAAAVAAAEGRIRAEANVVVAPEPEPEAKVEAKGGAEEEEREYKSDMRKLEELMSKLNPSAQEFVPLSRRATAVTPPAKAGGGVLSADAPVFVSAAEYFGAAGVHLPMGGGGGSRDSSSDGSSNGGSPAESPGRGGIASTRGGGGWGADPDGVIGRIVTEQKLAEVFSTCGQSEDEKEMVSRTVYCTNIDKKVTEDDVKIFFQRVCGKVSRLRLLGDYVHSTCIAFVEFAQAESAILALNFSGMVLGSLPIRVSPSKTPVRPRSPREMSN
ncbi:hypothetical protein PR202_ga07029 [Eleusine coracana subsp. coracana]|uniref:RRM domain-containing protein n=1 Tax=Eleusine coracana subsp. coracana TaxID=191504 RepID=A0AAV5BXK5_ELECO|nr:hypothetical protein PR202_ga07029 [Eleusine coracana subsp. coracana]